jgi:hypothetical protein
MKADGSVAANTVKSAAAHVLTSAGPAPAERTLAIDDHSASTCAISDSPSSAATCRGLALSLAPAEARAAAVSGAVVYKAGLIFLSVVLECSRARFS